MDEVKETPFANLEFPEDALIERKKNILFITKFNWDFTDCEKFQLRAVDFIKQNKDLKIYIFTNHPHCFTLGRGNERDQTELIDFDHAIIPTLSFPLHKIHRGGGITFHYPGQWIFYPISAVSERYSLDDHMCWILTKVKNVLKQDFDISNALSAKKLMGIWVERKKLASIGVGLKHFVTLHGLALNLVTDTKMFSELSKINPCGLSSEVYTCLDQLADDLGDNLVENFHHSFIKSIC